MSLWTDNVQNFTYQTPFIYEKTVLSGICYAHSVLNIVQYKISMQSFHQLMQNTPIIQFIPKMMKSGAVLTVDQGTPFKRNRKKSKKHWVDEDFVDKFYDFLTIALGFIWLNFECRMKS